MEIKNLELHGDIVWSPRVEIQPILDELSNIIRETAEVTSCPFGYVHTILRHTVDELRGLGLQEAADEVKQTARSFAESYYKDCDRVRGVEDADWTVAEELKSEKPTVHVDGKEVTNKKIVTVDFVTD